MPLLRPVLGQESYQGLIDTPITEKEEELRQDHRDPVEPILRRREHPSDQDRPNGHHDERDDVPHEKGETAPDIGRSSLTQIAHIHTLQNQTNKRDTHHPGIFTFKIHIGSTKPARGIETP